LEAKALTMTILLITTFRSNAVRALDAAAHNAAVQSAVGAVPEVRT
jgi:hypothetical protein